MLLTNRLGNRLCRTNGREGEKNRRTYIYVYTIAHRENRTDRQCLIESLFVLAISLPIRIQLIIHSGEFNRPIDRSQSVHNHQVPPANNLRAIRVISNTVQKLSFK